jgi:hypothetical protein
MTPFLFVIHASLSLAVHAIVLLIEAVHAFKSLAVHALLFLFSIHATEHLMLFTPHSFEAIHDNAVHASSPIS